MTTSEPASGQLRNALLSLKPSGVDGFEGLLAVALRGITGIPFRLAASGSQLGIDGRAIDDEGSVCFEAKRYDGSISRDAVLAKIPDFVRGQTHPDLVWMLGATCEVSTQLADAIRLDGSDRGIVTLIVDWLPEDAPALAVLLAMGGPRVHAFIEAQVSDRTLAGQAVAELDALREHTDYGVQSSRLLALLDAPSVATENARRANCAWLETAFSSKEHARAYLGQALAPRAEAALLPRAVLSAKLRAAFFDPPQERVAFVVGDEGCGKSWAVAQAWLQAAERPLTILLSPEGVPGTHITQRQVEDLVIGALIDQTDDKYSQTVMSRWRSRIHRWQRSNPPDRPRLAVILDGINQRPNEAWARLIDQFAFFLAKCGGSLIVTVRTSYFKDQVQSRLFSKVIETAVPAWTDEERDEILRISGIQPKKLKGRVAVSLRNPRLLGIAVEMHRHQDITDIEELSISHILFEHVRWMVRSDAEELTVSAFARRLQSHAKHVLDRVQQQQQEDLHVFEADFAKVADGHFFQVLPGEGGRYQLKEDGLVLALGFSLLDQLRQAHRNGKDLDDVLEVLLQPISSLDHTGDVVLAALTIITVGGDYDASIAAALVLGFTALQNPDQGKFAAFRRLAQSRGEGFMRAMRVLCLSNMHRPNADWVQAATLALDVNDAAVRTELCDWLSAKSLSPELGMLTHPKRDAAEKVAKERTKRQFDIEEKLAALSPHERALVDRLPEFSGNVTRLSRFALMLLAGKPLASFAEQLVNWCFANALNSELVDGYQDFLSLVRLNRVDWEDGRTALLQAARALSDPGTSLTGRWAFVAVLRSTGSIEDAREAERLLIDLTKDQPSIGAWRLVEKYCSSDPCDPEAGAPDNIDDTAGKYAAIAVASLRSSLGYSLDDHFFDDARPAAARFAPNAAVAKHVEFIGNVITRAGASLQQGLYEIEEHMALVEPSHAAGLLRTWRSRKQSGAELLTRGDGWMLSQYLVLLSLAHSAPLDRLKILLEMPDGSPVMIKLLSFMLPVTPAELDEVLEKVVAGGSPYQARLLLEYVDYCGMDLTAATRIFAAGHVTSSDANVRSAALGLTARRGDDNMLQAVVDSDWKAAAADDRDTFEAWHGSTALVRAAQRGFIGPADLMSRSSDQVYGQMASSLGGPVAQQVAQRVDAAIQRLGDVGSQILAPDIEMEMGSASKDQPARIRVWDRPPRSSREAFERLARGQSDGENRWRRNYDAFDGFRAELTRSKARIVIDHLRPDEFAAIAQCDEALSERWFKTFLDWPLEDLPAIHNLVLLLANVFSAQAPAQAQRLFAKVRHSKPLVRFVYGADIDLDLVAIWSASDSEELAQERTWRLDSRSTNHELAREVLAALVHSRSAFLQRYIEARLKLGRPADIARAIMVAGFSDEDPFNTQLLQRFANLPGFLGRTQAAACYAYDRNIWARHWYKAMCETDSPVEFWRCQVLLNKIADGRFEFWSKEFERKGAPAQAFGESAAQQLAGRYKKWKAKREDKFLGSDAPDPIFTQ